MPLNCEDILRQAMGRGMTEAEALEFADEARDLARRAQAANNGAMQGPALQDILRKHFQDKQVEIMARQRATELHMAAKLKAVNYALEKFKGMEWEGVSAMMVGSKYNREGARLSVDALRSGLAGKYLGGFMNDIEALGPGYYKMLASGSMEKQIMEAMFTLDRNPQAAYSGPNEALAIARVINKWQELVRVEENDAGAWIGKLPGYIMRQSHDAARLSKAGFEAWRDEMMQRLDWTMTLEGKLDPVKDVALCHEYLRNVYDNLVTGIHHKTNSDALTRPSVTGSVAAKVSHARSLHFKSGGDFFEYNQRFGRGNLVEAVIAGLQKSANDTALMRVFGPSPEANLAGIVGEIKEVFKARGDDKSIRKMNAQMKRLNNQMKELDGTLNIEGNPALADVGRVVRAVESMSKLGGALISGFSDIPLLAQEFKYQGRSYFRSMADGLALFARGRGTQEQRQILSSCGVFFDSMCGSLMSRFSGQELPGKMTALMNLFFKLNGLSFWSDAWKKSATLMMSHDLALLKDTPWSSLSPQRQRVLSLYGIDDGRWDLLRAAPMKAADGRMYFTPEAAGHARASAIEAYMKGKGMLVSPERVSAFRTELSDQLRSYFRDRVQYAILEPDARTQSIVHQGLSSGTVPGELIRYAMQFKSFPVVFLQRTMGREIYGRGADTALAGLAQALIPKGGEITGLCGMIMMTTIFGYLSMTCKQLIAGKNPRDFTESPEAFRDVFIASLVQGGGMGLYGDFLFGEKSRVGDSFLGSLAGPAMGSLSSLVSLYQSMRDGEDVESQAFRTVWSHIPGNNLFWIKPAMDHMLLYSMYEYMNPGYLKRLRKKIKRENNQTFYVQPNVWSWAKGRHKKKRK